MQPIVLSGKRELDIYINPQRQRLLRTLAIAGTSMTPKQLSGVLGISASAVQHHIQKLVTLGVVAESHTELIHGITAHFYHALPVTVRIGYGVEEGLEAQRFTLMQNGVNEVLQGFSNYIHNPATPLPPSYIARTKPVDATNDAAAQTISPYGDVLWGIARLTGTEAGEVMAMVREFLHTHEIPSPERVPWEYALIAYPVPEEPHA